VTQKNQKAKIKNKKLRLRKMENSDSKKEFSQIYDKCINKIYRFIYLKIGSQETAEDICSDVFTRFWLNLNRGEKIDNPQAFIFQIARNLVADHYRQNKVKFVPIQDCPEIEDSQPSLEEKALSKSDFDRIKMALNKIKPEYQDLIIFHYLDELSVPEIAKIMSKSEGNIRVILHRGLKALKNECNKLA